MERMLVVVFDNEQKAYDGSKALKELDFEDSISIHAEAVVKKNADGTVSVKQEGDDFPVRTVGGTAIGALIGLLGGPVGVAVGTVTGTFAGSILDMNRAGVNAEFLDDVSAKLTLGKWAVVADVEEEWVTPVDTRMDALGGMVYRTTRKQVKRYQNVRDISDLKADVAQLKAEHAKARADRKAKLQTKIDNLNKKLHAKVEQEKQRSKQQKEEARAKVDALKKKAAKAKGEPKAKIEARIAEIEKEAKEDEAAFDKWLNEEGSA
jgi:uncharacterized membrane protein